MNFDLALIETGNGGDLQLLKNDLAVVNYIENMPYLGMFGGNLKQSTENTNPGQPQLDGNFDWWGNNLLIPANGSIQFNSMTERILNSTPLTSEGRIIIQNTIISDLQFLSPEGTITVQVNVISDDVIEIGIKMLLKKDVKIITVRFKKGTSGDFSILDFNNDFFK